MIDQKIVDEVMSRLPPEPKREDFDSVEEFEEARDGWKHRFSQSIRLVAYEKRR